LTNNIQFGLVVWSVLGGWELPVHPYIRMLNPDWARSGAGDGGGWFAPEKCDSCW